CVPRAAAVKAARQRTAKRLGLDGEDAHPRMEVEKMQRAFSSAFSPHWNRGSGAGVAGAKPPDVLNPSLALAIDKMFKSVSDEQLLAALRGLGPLEDHFRQHTGKGAGQRLRARAHLGNGRCS